MLDYGIACRIQSDSMISHLTGKLTPSRERLHLYENHPLITRWKAGNKCLVEMELFRNVINGSLPFAVATTKVGAKSSTVVKTESARDV